MKKIFIIASLCLVSSTIFDCSASNRRKKNVINVCRLEDEFNLRNLDNFYVSYQGQAQYWPQTLYSTNVIVSKILKKDMKSFSNGDKVAIWAFLRNRFSMQNFICSDYYNEENHSGSLINLFKLSAKLLASLVGVSDSDASVISKYANVVAGIDGSSNFVALVFSDDFEKIQSAAEEVLYKKISWILE